MMYLFIYIFCIIILTNNIKSYRSYTTLIRNNKKIKFYSLTSSIPSSIPNQDEISPYAIKKLYNKLDKDFAAVALPAFVSLAADPIASMVDAIYVARLGAVEQAAMGIINILYLISIVIGYV